jgi:lipopolysaccharide transport system ATP-binding protein
MPSDPRAVIRAEGVGKQFKRFDPSRPQTLKDIFVAGLKLRRLRPRDRFWALRGVSFEISRGEMLGIVGHNGAGKSTLLQLLGGVVRPTEGVVAIRGRVGALLELGSGFSPDLTGRENVFVAGVVAGLSRAEVAARLDAIIGFAELEDAMEQPVRAYSTGMQMRLAFAVAIHCDPQILLVDEFLSVGDLAFQTKCLERIADLRQAGCAIALVSHNPDQVRQLCDRALWLRHGQVVALGEADSVVGRYVAEMRSETARRTPAEAPTGAAGDRLRLRENRFGSQEAEVTAVRLLPSARLRTGDPLTVEIDFRSSKPLESPNFSVTICRDDGQVCYDANPAAAGVESPDLQTAGTLTLKLARLDLVAGNYWVDVGIFEKSWAYAFDYHWRAYPLYVSGATGGKGLLAPPANWQLRGQQTAAADSLRELAPQPRTAR